MKRAGTKGSKEQVSPAPAVSRGRPRRRRATVWFCGVFVTVQILVPLTLLAKPDNKPFGWQMYSSVSGHSYEAVLADGSTRAVDPREYVLRYRSEVDYWPYLPGEMCRTIQGARQVVATDVLGTTTQRYACER